MNSCSTSSVTNRDKSHLEALLLPLSQPYTLLHLQPQPRSVGLWTKGSETVLLHAHVDFDFLTLLSPLTASSAALQIKPGAGPWVMMDSDVAVVNAWDALADWLFNRLRSAVVTSIYSATRHLLRTLLFYLHTASCLPSCPWGAASASLWRTWPSRSPPWSGSPPPKSKV